MLRGPIRTHPSNPNSLEQSQQSYVNVALTPQGYSSGEQQQLPSVQRQMRINHNLNKQ